jgi:hypothetical protein
MLGHVLKSNPNQLIGTLCQVPASNPGTIGTPDDSGWTGTATVTPSGTPLDYYEIYLKWGKGGTLGIDTDMTYYLGKDEDNHLSPLRALNDNTTIEVPFSGITLSIDPPAAGLVTLVNDIRTKVLAHLAEGSSIHTTADITSGVGIGSAATDLATVITLEAQLRAALLLHAVNTYVHGAADSTLVTALTALSTEPSIVARLNAVKSAYNTHHTKTTSSIHGASSDTHTVTASDATVGGTINDGEVWRVTTTAPYPSSDDVTDAFTALKTNTSAKYCILAFASVVNETLAEVIKSGLTDLNSKGKRVLCVYPVRNQNDDTEEDWIVDVVGDFDGFDDDRQLAAAAPAICTVNNGNETLTLSNANALTNVLAHVMSFERPSIAWNDVSKGPIPGVKLHNKDGVLAHHDEDGGVQGLDEAHFMTLRTIPEDSFSGQVYVSRPRTLFGTTSKIPLAQIRMVANKAERIANRRTWGNIGNGLVYKKLTDSTGILSDSVRGMMASVLRGDLSEALKNDISNPKDPQLVAVDQNVTIVDQEIQVTVYLNITMLGYVGKVTIKLSVK